MYLWTQVVDKGNGEGIMLKHKKATAYGKNWTKVKKEDTVDCFILSATPGKGKYEGQIGTLELAVYSGDTIYPIGKISNVGTDSDRLNMTNLAREGKLKNRVIEVKYNEVTKNLKLRHGRFIRWRDDKAPAACLVDQLKDK
jgi:ATP-dependent DNA ligase